MYESNRSVYKGLAGCVSPRTVGGCNGSVFCQTIICQCIGNRSIHQKDTSAVIIVVPTSSRVSPSRGGSKLCTSDIWGGPFGAHQNHQESCTTKRKPLVYTLACFASAPPLQWWCCFSKWYLVCTLWWCTTKEHLACTLVCFASGGGLKVGRSDGRMEDIEGTFSLYKAMRAHK